jgi:NADH-quinone oxidoreductase subunit C
LSSAPEDSETEQPAAAEAEEEAAAPVDTVREAILEGLKRDLGDAIVGHEIANGDITIRVSRESWRAAGEAAKRQGFDYFCFLSAIDWLPNPGLSGEKLWDPDATPDENAPMTTGIAGGDTRFQVFARLYDVRRFLGVTFKADLDDANPSVDSWVPVFAGADWHERETWEMYGFDFVGHPGLRHLYLPSEFEGFPGRKDFPMLAREVKPWPGLVDVEPMPGEPDEGEAAEGEEATSE